MTRARAVLALVLLAAALAVVRCGGESGARATPTATATRPGAEAAASLDPRIAELLAVCPQGVYYDRDTADMLPVLIEKLQKGLTEPLQRSKDELAGMGEEALREVQRLAERWFNDPAGASYAQNALDVAVLSETEIAREIVLRFLDHPRDALRRIAVRGLLLHHVRPVDFERLWIQLEAEGLQIQEMLVPCLHAADPARAEELFLGWLEAESHRELDPYTTPLLAASEIPATRAAAAALAPEVRPELRPFLAAPAARAGDEAALASLRSDLAADDLGLRIRAAQACVLAGLADLLQFSLEHDPAPEVRRIAVMGVAGELARASPQTSARLREAMGDQDRDVRVAALHALVTHGDAGAAEHALALLDGSVTDMEDALFALRERWEVDPELARRGAERLIARDRAEEQRALDERLSVFKALGSVPVREAAAYLREVGLRGGTVSGKRAHELLAIFASNAGEDGRAFLFEELASETDPARRLDLLYATAAHRTDGARERLREFVERADASPYEILFAADMLARLGPAQEVAPLLKRVCYRVEQEDVQLALRCLLWRWY